MSGKGAGQTRVIVIAVDGSHYAEHAFEFFMDNYYKPKDHILVLHCQEYRSVLCTPASALDACTMRAAMDDDETEEKELLNKFGDRLQGRRVSHEAKTCYGNPGETIVHEAWTHNAAMIVVGTRGMGTLRRTLLGSVTDYLLHHAPCPVFVNRDMSIAH